MVKWVFETPHLGMQPITVTATTQKPYYPWKVGDILRAVDADTNTTFEFVYLPGAAGTTAGAAVTYNPQTFATTVGGTPGTAAVPTIAMSANTAGRFGWYKLAREPGRPAA